MRLYDNQSVLQSYWYGDGAGGGGLLDNDGAWAVRVQTGTNPLELRCDNNAEFYVYTTYTYSPGSSRAPIFYDSDNTGYYLSPNSTSVMKDIVIPGGNRDSGVFGTYDSTKTQHIWSMGTSYRNNAAGTDFGNLYGAAYKHTNNATGGTMAGGHQFVWCQNGTPNAALGSNIWTSGNVTASNFISGGAAFTVGYGTGAVQRMVMNNGQHYFYNTAGTQQLNISTGGDLTATGNVTAYSDQRLKDNIRTIDNALDKVASLRGVHFEKDGKEGSGVIAQELEQIAPELVLDGEYKSVAYGNMVGYLIEAIKDLKAVIDELKSQINN